MLGNLNTLKTTVFGVVLACSLSAFAEEPSSPPAANMAKTKGSSSQMSPELKKEMADMYQKMADCMKTEKPMDQCQKDIVKDCPVAAKTGHCPLMEGMRPMMKGMPMMPKGMKHPMGDDSTGQSPVPH